MKEKKLEAFRIFYNHTIHPELMRMERLRKRLLLLLFASFFAFIAMLLLAFYFNVLVITLFLMIPIGLYAGYLVYRIQNFRATFKPNVVNLVLDFMDNDVNYGELSYEPTGFIPKSKFQGSMIFGAKAHEYKGEDKITGSIGELPFEMCELKVRDFSKVRSRLNYVFRGVFLCAEINQEVHGSILVVPRIFRQYLEKAIKDFNRIGGKNVEDAFHIEEFVDTFLIYATPSAPYRYVLSEPMQWSLLEFCQKTGRDVYISLIGNSLNIAVAQPKDLLEPFLFRPNVSFDLIRTFFEDVQMVIQIVSEFDEKI